MLRIFFLVFISIGQISHAQTEKDSVGSMEELFKTLDYPELQVVPRASERLKSEAEAERAEWYLVNWPLLVSSTATFFAANSLKGSYRLNPPLTAEEKATADDSVTLGSTIGISGMILSLGLPFLSAYSGGLEKVRAIKGNDKKSVLLRERMSEEALERQSTVMNVFRYGISFANLLASARMQEKANPNQTQFAAISTVMSILPLVFVPAQVRAYRKHQEYKKKIYTPVASLGISSNGGSHFQRQAEWSPSLVLNWSF